MNIVDKTVSFFSPKLGLERAKLRVQEKAFKNAKRSFDGASKARRGDGWTSGGSKNQNTDILRSVTDLRERSIDGYKNNSNVFKAIRTIQNNVIGTGIMPTPIPMPGDPKISSAELKKIKAAWEWFVKNSDFDEVFNFFGLQALSMRNIAMQGEIFVLKQRNAKGLVPFQIQVLGPHMVDHQSNSYAITNRPGNYIVQGVEFDSRGKKVGYWVFEYNPNNEYVLKIAPKFVSVDDMLQVFYKEFPEQVRGYPFGTATMLNMRDLGDYEDAQLMLQKVSACHVAFTTKPAPESDLGGEEDSDVDHLEPGMIEHLAPGEEVTFNTPPTPQGYSDYVTKNQQKNAAGYGITFEQLTGDMSNANFTQGRMGWIEAHKQLEDWQYNMFIPQFCDKIWNWFVEGIMVKGIIKRKVDADWTPQGREMLDPTKEMNALVLELKSGLVSWTEACKRRGYNPDVLMEQMKQDKETFKNAGIDVEWIVKNEDQIKDASGENALSPDEIKKIMDAYSVGVRAGVITPTEEDEKFFRSIANYPGMTEAVMNSWLQDNGFRRPITLAVPVDNSNFQA